tara:strand:- start:318 stop:764 length:447 start_codon:yes stop_codon:yes gene_type:complete
MYNNMEINKILMIIELIVIDSYLLYILFKNNTTHFETLFIYIMFFSHLLLFTGLVTNDVELTDLMHLLYVLALFIGTIILSNKNILMLLILIVIINILYWLVLGECPLGKVQTHYLIKYQSFLSPFIESLIFLLLSILIFKYIVKLYS